MKRQNFTYQVLKCFWLPMLVLLITPGCLSNSGSSKDSSSSVSTKSKSSSNDSSSTSSTEDSEGYNCPSEANVTPNYDWHHDGTGEFTVCQHKDDSSNILIHGKTNVSTTICVFPTKSDDESTSIYLSSDQQSVRYQCASAKENGVYIALEDFSSYNGVFVVESPYASQMEHCLFMNNGYLCPSAEPSYYSYGSL